MNTNLISSFVAALTLVLSLAHKPPGAHAHLWSKGEEGSALERIMSAYRENVPSGYQLFQKPTAAPEEQLSGLPEWKPTSHLLLAYPGNTVLNTQADEILLDIVENVAPSVDVVILVPEDQLLSLNHLVQEIRDHGLGDLITRNKVRFMITSLDSQWIRDYGPLFAQDAAGITYIIDPLYYDVRNEFIVKYNPLQARALGVLRNQDDVIPSHIRSFLREANKLTRIIRPPILLSGGDFYTDGAVCFTSTETLLRNGGSYRDTTLVFKRYFGCNKVIYLKPLPGPTVKHIDMFFKVVDHSTFIVGEYENLEDPESPTWYLQKHAKEILDENVSILYKELGKERENLRVIRMPMPDIIANKDPEKEKEKQEIVDQLVQQINSNENELDGGQSEWKELQYTVGLLNDVREKQERGRRLSKKLQQFDKLLLGRFVKLGAHILGQGAEVAEKLSKIATLDFYRYQYPTYLNSTVVSTEHKIFLLVPRYEGYRNMESEVEEAYRSAYGDAQIIFLNADHLLPGQGAIHCITNTIPSFDGKLD